MDSAHAESLPQKPATLTGCAERPCLQVGEVTSGAFSPSLNRNIAMGYVQKGNQKSGTHLKVVVRGRSNEAEVTKMPFVKTTYYRPS